MLDAFAKTFMTATRTRTHRQVGLPSHWQQTERFDNRENAEIEAHLMGRRA